MPLLKVFEIIENLFGFVNDEQQYQHKSKQSKRKRSETTDVSNNYVNKTISYSSVILLDTPSVSFIFLIY
jgi:hypothetical protein